MPSTSTSTLLIPTSVSDFITNNTKLYVVRHDVQLQGFQLYVVENWIVQRDHPVITLVVYTGDPSHNISVNALSPSPTLSPQDAQAEWEFALHQLRKDGARPRQTPHGLIMTTSLANFRSDYTIVHIPHGQFLVVQQQLYANINLLRMGCSGRSALALNDPSDTTRDRFFSMYHLPDPSSAAATPGFKSRSKTNSLDSSQLFKHDSVDLKFSSPDQSPSILSPFQHNTPHSNSLFNATVLELVKLVQAALAIFGMFPISHIGSYPQFEADGLLCDLTVNGIQRWVTEIGEPCVGVEPMERVADPIVVSALLSLVLVTRNKLAALGYSHLVPKDPFLHPYAFSVALALYAQSLPLATLTHSHPSFLPVPFISRSSATQIPMPAPISPTSSSSSASTRMAANTAVLTRALLDTISSAYDKQRHSDSRRVRRVLLNKLDDLRVGAGSDGELDGVDAPSTGVADGGSGQLLSGIGSLASGFALGLTGSGASGPGNVMDVMVDLGAFARAVVGRGDRDEARERRGRSKGKESEKEWSESWKDPRKEKDGVGGCLRALWSGKVASVVRMRERERDRTSIDRALARKSGKDRSALSDGDVDEAAQERERTEGKSTEDESEAISAFAGIGRGRPWPGRVQKKIEFWAGLNRKKHSADLSVLRAGGPAASSTEASIPVTGDKERDPGEEEELLSSGQGSPVLDTRPNPLNLPLGALGNSALSLQAASDYDRQLSAFNRSWPSGKGPNQSRVSSWADPVSAREVLDGSGSGEIDDKLVGSSSPSVSASRSGSRSGSNARNSARPRLKSALQRSSTLAAAEGVGVTHEEAGDHWERSKRSMLAHGATRRRSFHDLASFRDTRVLTTERMRIDVELCGQWLVVSRRERYLESMLSCLQALTSSLSEKNASLREDYQSHQQFFLDIEAHTKVIAQIEAQRLKVEKSTQEINTLLYESEQFHMRDLWRMASSPRQKVLALRETVFGTGGRRLPSGVHGAHERFNRLQWTLDGRERLVDWMGRTESEAREEHAVGIEEVLVPREEDEEDVVEHSAIKPMWLLRFFHTWGVRWSSTKQEDEKARNGEKVPAKEPVPSEPSTAQIVT